MDSARQAPTQSGSNQDLTRTHPTAAPVLRRWRALTGGSTVPDTDRQSLIACSGGPDSIALSAILALVTPKPTIAHIIHDLRPPKVTALDRDAVAKLAKDIGCVFVERSIHIADQQGNTEHNARTARYEALAQIASEHNLNYIATGHHADDQLETMLMNLSRGAGPRGLAGINDARLFKGVTIIRPMLCITHLDALDLCELANIHYTHDHTNDDQSLTRNKLRHQLLPVLRDLDPEIAIKASTAADSCRSTVHALRELVKLHVWPLATTSENIISFTRDQLRNQPDAALAEIFHICIDHLRVVGRDRLTQQAIHGSIRAIKDSSTDPRTCRLGPIVITVTANQITMTPFNG